MRPRNLAGFDGATPSAVAHSPRPGGAHHRADVAAGGGGDGAGVQDGAAGIAEQGDEFTRFRLDEHGRARATTEHVSSGEDDGHAGIPRPVYRPRRRVCATSQRRPSAVAHSPRPARAHLGADVGRA